MANLNLVTVITIFSSKIIKLRGHYILVQAIVIQTHISMHSIKEKACYVGEHQNLPLVRSINWGLQMSCHLYVGKTLVPIFLPILTCTCQCHVVDNTHINCSRYKFQGTLFKWRQSYFSGALWCIPLSCFNHNNVNYQFTNIDWTWEESKQYNFLPTQSTS